MNKVTLLGTDIRCDLRNIQGVYAKKYSAGSLLAHEEKYILDSFKLLFEDTRRYFGSDLLMYDAYYLRHDERINNICEKLQKKSESYSGLVKKFNSEYAEWINKAKQQTEKEPLSIVSISHELIANNKKTGLCLFKTGHNKRVNSAPADCEFFNLDNVLEASAKRKFSLQEIFRETSKRINDNAFNSLCSKFGWGNQKKNGIARTILLYDTLLKGKNNGFVYFIRPRIAHGKYNGTLVVMLKRQLTELEFNMLSSFLNEILCETAIAKFVSETEFKTRENTAEELGDFLWGGDRSNKGKKSPTKETIELQNNLKSTLKKCLADSVLMDNINSDALLWVNNFIAFINNHIDDNTHTLTPDFSNHQFKHEHRHINILEDEILREKFVRLFKVRKVVTLLCKLRDENKLSFTKEAASFKMKLPWFVLIAICDRTCNKMKPLSPNTYKKFISAVGLQQRKKGEMYFVTYKSPYISKEEQKWIDIQVEGWKLPAAN